MPVRISGATSGYVELAAPAVAGTTVLTLPLTGFGKVLQVVQGTLATNFSFASTTYADSGLTATITPSASSSRVLVICNVGNLQRIGTLVAADSSMSLKVLRDATNIWEVGGYLELVSSAQVGASYVCVPGPTMVTLDSPNTVAATTYKLQAKNAITATNGLRLGAPCSLILVEIGA